VVKTALNCIAPAKIHFSFPVSFFCAFYAFLRQHLLMTPNAPDPNAAPLKLFSVVIPACFCSLSANGVGGEGRGEVARCPLSCFVFSFAPFVLFGGHLFLS
jgi:hypothetical protein